MSFQPNNAPFNQLSPTSDTGDTIDTDAVQQLTDRLTALEEAHHQLASGVGLDQLPMADVMRFLSNNWAPESADLLLSGGTISNLNVLGLTLPAAPSLPSPDQSVIKWVDSPGAKVADAQGGIDAPNNRTFLIVEAVGRSAAERSLATFQSADPANGPNGASVTVFRGAAADPIPNTKVNVNTVTPGGGTKFTTLIDGSGHHTFGSTSQALLWNDGTMTSAEVLVSASGNNRNLQAIAIPEPGGNGTTQIIGYNNALTHYSQLYVATSDTLSQAWVNCNDGVGNPSRLILDAAGKSDYAGITPQGNTKLFSINQGTFTWPGGVNTAALTFTHGQPTPVDVQYQATYIDNAGTVFAAASVRAPSLTGCTIAVEAISGAPAAGSSYALYILVILRY